MTTATLTKFEELNDTDSRRFLEQHHLGRIAFTLHDRVDIEPISYTLDRDWLVGRTSIGTKLASLAHHPWCAFEVDEVIDSSHWTSVVAKGTFYLLDPESGSPDLYARAVACVKALYPQAFSPDDTDPHRTVLFGIHVNEFLGKVAYI